MKQGKEQLHLAKEEEKSTKNYIFQKNAKTKVGFTFILMVLIALIVGILISGFQF